MKVGRSVTKAIDEWQAGDFESAMLHACNAVDGTARKRVAYAIFGKDNRKWFCQLLRDDFEILGKFGMPGIDLERTKFPIELNGKTSEFFDIADILYKVHRCTQGHGEDLPQGFDLIPDAAGPAGLTNVVWDTSKLRLSDRMIFGMIAVCVAAPENADQVTEKDYRLSFGGTTIMPINEWWGRRNDFLEVVRSVELPSVYLDFSNIGH